MNGELRVLLALTLFTSAMLMGGCGSKDAQSGASDSNADTSADSGQLDPCKLLSDEQVRVVVPKLTGSMVTHSGGSLIQGVDAYQCAYVDAEANGLNVILNIAADEALFAEIKGSSSRYENADKVDIGDEAWVYPRDQGLNVTVHKGFTVIDLELSGPDATQKSKELVELARAVTAKVG